MIQAARCAQYLGDVVLGVLVLLLLHVGLQHSQHLGAHNMPSFKCRGNSAYLLVGLLVAGSLLPLGIVFIFNLLVLASALLHSLITLFLLLLLGRQKLGEHDSLDQEAEHLRHGRHCNTVFQTQGTLTFVRLFLPQTANGAARAMERSFISC